MIKPVPTKRAMIEVGMKCNLSCMFCYYHHLGDLSKQHFTDIEQLKADVNQAKYRGNNYIDISGGEPTIYPEIGELVKHIKSKNMGCRIITNALLSENRIDELIYFGVDEFLISIHGIESVHNHLVGHPQANQRVIKFIEHVKGKVKFSFNTVINRFNEQCLEDMVNEFKHYKPVIWNFINFNPHYAWSDKEKEDEAKNILADLTVVEVKLDRIIPILEGDGIGVNLRYYPMCRIKENYRRCVCNDYQVSFDPYEWDNGVYPKSIETHLRWALDISNRIELKDGPCKKCNLQYICGGINKAYFGASKQSDIVTSITTPIDNKHDFYYYRKKNYLTLQEAVK